jgi:hypothetical protein
LQETSAFTFFPVIMAHFLRQSRKKPGFPLQVLDFAYAKSAGFPLQSLARPSGNRDFASQNR